MTRKYKGKTVTYQSEELISITCDWCGVSMEDPRGYDDRDFDLEFTEGASYPGSGDRTGWKVADLCDRCVKRLRTLLEEKGVTISAVDVSW